MGALICLFKGHDWSAERGDFASHCKRCPANVDIRPYMN